MFLDLFIPCYSRQCLQGHASSISPSVAAVRSSFTLLTFSLFFHHFRELVKCSTTYVLLIPLRTKGSWDTKASTAVWLSLYPVILVYLDHRHNGRRWKRAKRTFLLCRYSRYFSFKELTALSHLLAKVHSHRRHYTSMISFFESEVTKETSNDRANWWLLVSLTKGSCLQKGFCDSILLPRDLQDDFDKNRKKVRGQNEAGTPKSLHN